MQPNLADGPAHPFSLTKRHYTNLSGSNASWEIFTYRAIHRNSAEFRTTSDHV